MSDEEEEKSFFSLENPPLEPGDGDIPVFDVTHFLYQRRYRYCSRSTIDQSVLIVSYRSTSNRTG
jgi:hypothetical protein